MTTLVQITDVHLTSDGTLPGGVDPAASLTAALDAVAAVRPDALLLTGDLELRPAQLAWLATELAAPCRWARRRWAGSTPRASTSWSPPTAGARPRGPG